MSDLSTPEENAPAEVAQASSQRGFALPEPIAHRQGLFGAAPTPPPPASRAS